MTRWGIAVAALAAAVLLALVATTRMESGRTISLIDDNRPAAEPTGASLVDASGHPATATNRAIIKVPQLKAGNPRLLRLTRPMLEQAWHDGELDVLGPAGRYRVVIEDQRFEPGGQWTVVGRVESDVGAQAMVLTFGHDAVFGVLPQPDGSLLQITTARGITAIAAAGGLQPPGSKRTLAIEPDYLIPDTRQAGVATSLQHTRVLDAAQLKSTSLVEVVVLGLYTDNLVQLRGSVSAAETEVASLFAIANQSHIDSGTRVRLRLAGQRKIALDPALDNSQALWAITDNTVPGIDLAQLRDAMAADLLALVRPHVDTYGTCGVAWLNGEGRSPEFIWDHYGVSVSNVAPCGPYVLAHEIGHNMGSAHDREAHSGNGQLEFGAYRYSFGYRQDGPVAFATIMAYSQGEPWIGYFSNPRSNVCGAPCGVENRADNVRSLGAIAPLIAAFRGPPGTLSITDAEIYEPDPGSNAILLFRVLLSGAAPAGGVRFDAVVSGGSAQEGRDYLVDGYGHTGATIPEGERTANIVVEVVGEAEVEPDETIVLRLANVTGAAVHDGEAVGRILNDDPRLRLSGRLHFEAGAPVPQAPFWMAVSGTSGGNETIRVEVSPPDFTYQVPFVSGSSLTVTVEPPAPFAILPFSFDEVEASLRHDITLRKGLKVSGRLHLPAGQPAPTEPLMLDIRASIDARYQVNPYPMLSPPDFRYSHWVVPGAWVYMEVNPPAPYARFFAVHNPVLSDIVQDITLSPLPALVIWGGKQWRESHHGSSLTTAFVLELSAPAPAGGVRMRYRTVAGTARPGEDYTPVDGIAEIPAGETVTYTDQIEVMSDNILEGDEYFDVVLSDISGANPVVTRSRFIVQDPPRVMGGRLPPRRKK
ncbi:reprolysin-like metallopeptidase [Luteimonas sp. A482]